MRECATANPTDYGKMVKQYHGRLQQRAVNGNDMVMVLANTYSFAEYWTKAFANSPSTSMPGAATNGQGDLIRVYRLATLAARLRGPSLVRLSHRWRCQATR